MCGHKTQLTYSRSTLVIIIFVILSYLIPHNQHNQSLDFIQSRDRHALLNVISVSTRMLGNTFLMENEMKKKKFMRIVYPHIKRQPNGPASTVRQTAFSTVCTAIAAFDCSFALLWFIHSDAQQTYRRSSLILSILFVSILGRQKWIDSFCILSGGAPCVCVLWKLQFAALPMDGSMNKIFRFRTIVGIPRKPLLIHR